MRSRRINVMQVLRLCVALEERLRFLYWQAAVPHLQNGIQHISAHKRQLWEIPQSRSYFNERGPDSDTETLGFFTELLGEKTSPEKTLRPGSICWTSTTTKALAEKYDPGFEIWDS
jgi:hypothetical protein